MDSIREEAAATLKQAKRTTSQAFAMEAETPKQMAKLALHYPRLLTEPRGDGHPIVVLPGYSASDNSTIALRRYLSLLGYGVHGWGLGVNTGDVATLAGAVISLAAKLAEQSGKRISLVGWSMGGNVSREVALLRPDLVRRVITMGSPITGGPKYTAFAAQLASSGVDLEAIERHLEHKQRSSAAFRVPVTAIFSRHDGVVAWQACIDQINQSVEHLEVKSSHIGLGFDPEVYRIIARRLAQPTQ
jgi:pimeloyl-ACP methyl ester carboxylesterase